MAYVQWENIALTPREARERTLQEETQTATLEQATETMLAYKLAQHCADSPRFVPSQLCTRKQLGPLFTLSQFHLGPVVELERGVLKPPSCDIDKLQGVVLAKDFLVAKNLHLLVSVKIVEQLLGNELLQVGDGGLRRAPDELAPHLLQLGTVRLQQDVDLLVRPVAISLVFLRRGSLGASVLLTEHPRSMHLGTGKALTTVEIPFPFHLIVLQIWHQLVYNVLHSSVVADVLQRVALMNHDFTGRACVVILQMFDQAALTKCMQTFGDRGGVD